MVERNSETDVTPVTVGGTAILERWEPKEYGTASLQDFEK
jgi:hypothetical protein